jgi:hypothetical protein
MKTNLGNFLRLLTVGLCVANSLRADTTNETLRALARDAISEEAAKSTAAIEQLRTAGPAGLDALFEEHGSAIAAHETSAAAGGSRGTSDPAWPRLAAALDAVGQQHDCSTSHLYWYTDLKAAKAAARASDKPILSLRLLGKLSEERSCANSRFFRTVLYPNAEVGKRLREEFVLHWESERPVPKVTVDFGDGRKLERTITGNSIHYILSADGQPIDALPGLYAPRSFLAGLEEARKMAAQLAATPVAERAAALRAYHARRLADLEKKWKSDASAAGLADLSLPPPLTSDAARENVPWEKIARAESRPAEDAKTVSLTLLRNPTAKQAMPLALSKSAVETPLLTAMSGTNFALDAGSIALIRAQNPTAAQAMPRTDAKSMTETPLLRMITDFERTLGNDTVRNEYLFHAQLHRWFLAENGTRDLMTLNRKVYAELFLTPASDPWLGLAPDTTYTALTDNGKR